MYIKAFKYAVSEICVIVSVTLSMSNTPSSPPLSFFCPPPAGEISLTEQSKSKDTRTKIANCCLLCFQVK